MSSVLDEGKHIMNEDTKLELEREALSCIYRKIENGVDGDIPDGGGFYLYPRDIEIIAGKATLKSHSIDDDGGYFLFTATYVLP